MKPLIIPKEPKLVMDTPIFLIICIPFLILYWCPTSAIIYLGCIEGFDNFSIVMTIWGLIATITIMFCIMNVIRGMVWEKQKTKNNG